MNKRICLGDLFKEKRAFSKTGPFGTQLKASDYVEKGRPVINVKNIGMGQVRINGLEYLDEKKSEQLKAHQLKENDIVFGRKGAVERHVLISKKEVGWIQGSDCIKLTFLSDDFNPKFISHFFKTKRHQQWMINLGSFGATMHSLNQEIISKIEIPDIPRFVQDKIASILSAYDELIENNNQRIQLLEEMAEEIYKEWFVRFRFPGYEDFKFLDKDGKVVPQSTKGAIPEGWENDQVGNIITTVKRKLKVKKDLYKEKGTIPVIDQGDNLIAGYVEDEKYLQAEPLPLLVFGDHTRRLKFVDYPFASGADGTQLLYPKDKALLPTYFYLAIKSIDLSNFHYARHFKFLKKESILIPDTKTLSGFNKLTSPFLKKIDLLRNKNQILQETRDLLLPRLISGKLSVAHLLEDETLPMAAEPQATYSTK